MEGERERVFVYGTLRRGASNHFRMEGAEWVGSGSLPGFLYRLSWYPGLVLDPEGGPVVGEVFFVPPRLLETLDEFEGLAAGELEGAEYRRVRAEVTLELAAPVEAWVWEWCGPAGGASLIAGGDWLAAGH
jgi:gamma-glutamylcyclotransferase (GGCT)/AIG2-like uncharacterized protein YtfP